MLPGDSPTSPTKVEAIRLVSEVIDERPGQTAYEANNKLAAAQVLALVYIGDGLRALSTVLRPAEKTVVDRDG